MKRYEFIIYIIISSIVASGFTAFTMWHQIDAARENGMQCARSEITRDMKQSFSHGELYVLPGTNVLIEAKIKPKGLKIISLRSAQAAAERAGK